MLDLSCSIPSFERGLKEENGSDFLVNCKVKCIKFSCNESFLSRCADMSNLKKRNGEKPDNNTSLFYLKMSQDACTRGKQTQK